MRNFLRLAQGVAILPLLHEVAQQPHLWNACTLRTAQPESPHSQADDIILRLQPLDGRTFDKRECIWFEAAQRLPQARMLTHWLMSVTQGERLGRVMITRLAKGGHIPAHTDYGTHPLHYDTIPYWARHHICLAGNEGCLFRCEDEIAVMQPGEAWWFNSALEHEVMNHGESDRLHLIVDIHTAHCPGV